MRIAKIDSVFWEPSDSGVEIPEPTPMSDDELAERFDEVMRSIYPTDGMPVTNKAMLMADFLCTVWGYVLIEGRTHKFNTEDVA